MQGDEMRIANTQNTLEDKKVIYAHYERQLALLKEEISEREAETKTSLIGIGNIGIAIFNMFSCHVIANRYKEAFETMILLRQQPGSEISKEDVVQFIISINGIGKIFLFIEAHDDFILKIDRISPCFASEEDAQRAIDTVGAERILRMFKILHGVEV